MYESNAIIRRDPKCEWLILSQQPSSRVRVRVGLRLGLSKSRPKINSRTSVHNGIRMEHCVVHKYTHVNTCMHTYRRTTVFVLKKDPGRLLLLRLRIVRQPLRPRRLLCRDGTTDDRSCQVSTENFAML